MKHHKIELPVSAHHNTEALVQRQWHIFRVVESFLLDAVPCLHEEGLATLGLFAQSGDRLRKISDHTNKPLEGFHVVWH